MSKKPANPACNIRRFTVGVELSTLLVLAITGCGNAGPASLHDFSAALNQVECQARFKCCPSASAAKWANEAACEAALDGDPQKAAQLAGVEADIARGWSRYDAGAAGRLLDTARSWITSCDHAVDLHLFGVELSSVVVGTLPIGSACADSHVCASGACASGACAAAPMMSTPLADGQACAQDGDCASGRCHGTCASVTVTEILCPMP